MHNQTFTTKKNIEQIKLAVISDIHYYVGYKEKIFKNIINQIKNNKPDYITVVGDILDSSNITEINPLMNFFNELASIAKVIVTTGNHDEKSGHISNWKYKKNELLINELNKINNLYYLQDETYQENNITFYGFNPSFEYYNIARENYEAFSNEIDKLKTQIPKETYNITLLHTPVNIYKYLNNNPKHNLNNSDLILSGHMHNGLMPYWLSNFLNKTFKTSRGFISPSKHLFPKYAQGTIKESTNGYIYQGIYKLSHSTKIFSLFDFIYCKKVEFITIKKDTII